MNLRLYLLKGKKKSTPLKESINLSQLQIFSLFCSAPIYTSAAQILLEGKLPITLQNAAVVRTLLFSAKSTDAVFTEAVLDSLQSQETGLLPNSVIHFASGPCTTPPARMPHLSPRIPGSWKESLLWVSPLEQRRPPNSSNPIPKRCLVFPSKHLPPLFPHLKQNPCWGFPVSGHEALSKYMTANKYWR